MDSGTDGGTAPAFARVDFSESTSGEEADDGIVRICKTCMLSQTGPEQRCRECGEELVPIRAIRESYAGATVGEKYKLVEKIGSGGMGEVYLGHNEALDQRVAVKFLSKEYIANEQVIMRFLNEARSYCRVTHPNAVTLLDYGQHDDGALYIITEYVEGASLRDIVEEECGLPLRRAISIVAQCCSVLTKAHEQGVIHRDLKPDNVMLVPESGGGFTVKVLDFGIAKIVDDDREPLTETGSVFGTPEFMSPEQAKGVPVDPRADIYALGIILYFSLTGEIPFDGESQFSVLEKQINETPPRPTEALTETEIPLPLEAVILKCLNKRPEERYASAASLSEALDEAADELGLEGTGRETSPATFPPGSAPSSSDGSRTAAYPSDVVGDTAKPRETGGESGGGIDLSSEYGGSVLDLGGHDREERASTVGIAAALVASAAVAGWVGWGGDGDPDGAQVPATTNRTVAVQADQGSPDASATHASSENDSVDSASTSSDQASAGETMAAPNRVGDEVEGARGEGERKDGRAVPPDPAVSETSESVEPTDPTATRGADPDSPSEPRSDGEGATGDGGPAGGVEPSASPDSDGDDRPSVEDSPDPEPSETGSSQGEGAPEPTPSSGDERAESEESDDGHALPPKEL